MSNPKAAAIKRQNPVVYYAIVVICVAIMFLGKYITPFAPEITPVGMGVLGVFIGVVILWSSVGGSVWPSILAIVALGCTGFSTVTEAISSSLGAMMVFNILCICAMTSGLTASGADKKMAHWLITRKMWIGKPYLFTFVFLFAFFLISSVTFAMAMIFICWTILRKMADEVGVSMRHRYFVTMTIYAVVASSLGEFVIPIKGWQYALCNIFAGASGAPANIGLYILVTFIIGIVMMIIMVAVMKPLFKVDFTPIANYRPKEIQPGELRLNGSQLAILIVLIVSMLLSIFTNFLTGEGAFAKAMTTLGLPGIFGIALVILCIIKTKEGKPVLEFTKVMGGISWSPILLVGIATCLSSALTNEACGFMAFFSRTLVPLLAGKSAFVVYAFVIIVACVLTNVASNMGIGMMMIPIAVPIFQAAGCNMNVAAIAVMYTACFGFILPGAAAVSPLMYSNTDLTKPEILKTTTFAVVLYIIIGIIVFPVLDMLRR